MFRLKLGNHVYKPSTSTVAVIVLICVGLYVISLLVHLMSARDVAPAVSWAGVSKAPLRNLARPPKEEIFLSPEQSAVPLLSSSFSFAIFSTALSAAGCLSAESAIARGVQVDLVSSSVSSYLASQPASQVVLISLSSFIWFTPKSADLAGEFVKKFPGQVLLPASRICPGGDCVPAAVAGSFKFMSPKAVLGQASFLLPIFKGCEPAECLQRAYKTKRAALDSESFFFQDMQDVRMDHLEPLAFGDRPRPDGAWQAPREGGEIRNPETHTLPRLLIFGENFPAYAGKWRRAFDFQPQASVGGRSFLQEVCPHTVLPWLPLRVPAPNPFRQDARCSDVCIDSHVKCNRNEFPTQQGGMAECDPTSEFHCCSPSGWCGYTKDHCDCPLCVNYRDVGNKRRLLN